MQQIHIREAHPNDVDAIRDVQYRTWIATYPNDVYGITRADIEARFREDPAADPKVAQERRARSRRLLFNPPFHSWVALVATSLVGICTVQQDDHKSYLQMLYVLPDFQGKGIGKRLLQTALAWLGTEKDVTLDVASYNEKAIAFYHAFGFVARGPVPEAVRLPSGVRIPTIKMERKGA
jgi:ribosomal protein S18 acetylase RimI-like enzyme